MTDFPEIDLDFPNPVAEAPSEPTWRRFTADDEGALDAAVAAVRAGECVVMPTDTVYGIGADAFSSAAVQRLLDAKKRSADMPPPVLIAEPGMLRALTADTPQAALDLAKAFWPGALTLILKAQRTLHLQIGETGGTVAVRVPDQAWARDLLRRTGPLAVSSANISGEPAATTVDEAIEQLGNAVSVYLDGGGSHGGVASTIIDFTQGEGHVVRQGVLSFDALVAVAPGLHALAVPEPEPDADAATEPEPEALPETPAEPEAPAEMWGGPAVASDESVPKA